MYVQRPASFVKLQEHIDKKTLTLQILIELFPGITGFSDKDSKNIASDSFLTGSQNVDIMNLWDSPAHELFNGAKNGIADAGLMQGWC